MESECSSFCCKGRLLTVLLFSYQKAADLFQEAIDRAQVTQSSQQTWAITYMNLGTCFRKLK